jgi:hypothetical protein
VFTAGFLTEGRKDRKEIQRQVRKKQPKKRRVATLAFSFAIFCLIAFASLPDQ